MRNAAVSIAALGADFVLPIPFKIEKKTYQFANIMLVRYTSSSSAVSQRKKIARQKRQKQNRTEQNRQSNQYHGCFISNSLHENVDCEELFQELVVFSQTIRMRSPSRCFHYFAIAAVSIIARSVRAQQIFSLFHFCCMRA